jgi:hypothetical protein
MVRLYHRKKAFNGEMIIFRKGKDGQTNTQYEMGNFEVTLWGSYPII